jgi:acetyl-CoA carboxylase biotin carboxylase subunit
MIRKVLIANRGEIAVRISHTLREMGIQAVAVFAEPDKDALHMRIADEARAVGSYLDVQEIVRTAQECQADAIHPGYGFLSENPALSEACEQAGIIFIGPRPETIRKMGDKLESKRLMREAGVPVVPTWDGNVPASEFPVLVKAVGGGGGKGMRLVETPAQLKDAMSSAAREASAAFGNDRVFVEKYIRQPRHIEFQILGDSHGNVVHVFERECSIQRRHQKVIEETPSTAMTPELRAEMGTAAVAAARAVDYRGAGTVEFILDSSGQFHFLEMNTRLQVEHPVTEMTTSLDLVREQLLIASGEKLGYAQSDLRQTGHSIECRIYAEVPEENYRPSTGTIDIYEPPVGPGIRLDSGVAEGSTVTYHFDPLLAKLIVWASSRGAAIDRIKRALDEFVLAGVGNNIQFLRRIISTDDFATGKLDTGFLDRHPELFITSSETPRRDRVRADVWSAGPWRHSSGQTVPFHRDSDPKHKAQPQHVSMTSGSGEVRALMPGKILRVEVAPGDTVAEKQTVAIMESMKMESSLHAPKAGRVAEVRCKQGQVIDMGEIIMVIT